MIIMGTHLQYYYIATHSKLKGEFHTKQLYKLLSVHRLYHTHFILLTVVIYGNIHLATTPFLKNSLLYNII